MEQSDRVRRVAIYDAPHLYDRLFGPGPCEAFYLSEARRAHGPVLELACGTARLTVPLARDGHEIVGVDASATMLEAARRKARGVPGLTFVKADMRKFELDRQFALVIVSCNSLAHLTSIDELRGALARIKAHLRPGGRLAFDIVNPDVGSLGRPVSEPVNLEALLACDMKVRETAEYDRATQIRTFRWRIDEDGGPPCELSPVSLRQIFPQELPLLLQAAGLELLSRYGDFERAPFTSESLNQVCLAGVAS